MILWELEELDLKEEALTLPFQGTYLGRDYGILARHLHNE